MQHVLRAVTTVSSPSRRVAIPQGKGSGRQGRRSTGGPPPLLEADDPRGYGCDVLCQKRPERAGIAVALGGPVGKERVDVAVNATVPGRAKQLHGLPIVRAPCRSASGTVTRIKLRQIISATYLLSEGTPNNPPVKCRSTAGFASSILSPHPEKLGVCTRSYPAAVSAARYDSRPPG